MSKGQNYRLGGFESGKRPVEPPADHLSNEFPATSKWESPPSIKSLKHFDALAELAEREIEPSYSVDPWDPLVWWCTECKSRVTITIVDTRRGTYVPGHECGHGSDCDHRASFATSVSAGGGGR